MALNTQTFDDDFDSIPTTPKTATPQGSAGAATAPAPQAGNASAVPVTPATPPAAKAAAPEEEPDTTTADENENLSTDFDDEKVYARPGQLNQIRPEKGKAVRFAFIPREWIAPQTAKSHFVETTREGKPTKIRVRCLTPMGDVAEQAVCCQSIGKDGEIGVVALVVHYTNADGTTGKYEKDKDGKYPPVQFEIGFVRLSGFNMRQIKKLPDEDATPFSIDIVMTHADGRAFGYEFNRKSNVPRWTADPEVAAKVKAGVQRFLDGKVLRTKLGQKMNEIEWKALLSGKKPGEGGGSLGNVEEL